jgi:hypothetical protein
MVVEFVKHERVTMIESQSLFASAARADKETVQLQSSQAFDLKNIESFFNGITDMVVVLNNDRQIVYANQNFLNAVNVKEFENVKGLRLGEALNCIHAFEPPHGCGTCEFCRTCGAAKAIFAIQRGAGDMQECKITQAETGNAFDLLVKTSPLKIGDELFTLVAGKDISHEKRRRILERLFFHDVMNTASGVMGLTDLFLDAAPEDLERFSKLISRGAAKLVEEIKSQRDLTAAENGELVIEIETIDAGGFINEMIELYQTHEVAKGKFIAATSQIGAVSMQSSMVLLVRVLGNMIKNALEASRPGETVTVSCKKEHEQVIFQVHNPSFILRETQLQIFQRSFSTKSPERGLGTYSMKLFAERYLKGAISFASTKEGGTTFVATFPAILKKA